LRAHLGDVIVSVERAITQAYDGRGGQAGDIICTPAEELLLLAVHGTLHICGWDHAEPVEEAAMRSLERAVLKDAPGHEAAARASEVMVTHAGESVTRTKPA